MNSIVRIWARLFSVVGHPLVTISVFVLYLSRKELPSHQAEILSIAVIVGIVIPIVVHNIYRLYAGSYTNFDVSDQTQRKGFYPFALCLLIGTGLLLYFLKLPLIVLESILVFTLMVALFTLLNSVLKASLHAGINLFISTFFLHYDVKLALLFYLLSVLIGVSRIVLKRHTALETIVGALLGVGAGWINLDLIFH